jgi:hypothetical protein
MKAWTLLVGLPIQAAIYTGALVIPRAFADGSTGMSQHSEGACSPIIGTNQGTVTIECSGMSKEVGDQMLTLLNKILSSQVDQQIILKRLGDLSRAYETLNSKAINAQRGVISTYDFQGVKREQAAGQFNATVGEEHKVFLEIIDLQTKQQWQQLIKLCEKEISQTPQWLTPYIYAAQGYVMTGDNATALARLDYVVAQAGDDPQYQIAAKIAAELRGQSVSGR